MTNLREQGFRFVKRKDVFKWTHPAFVKSSDTDCTDMDDEQFERFVIASSSGLPGVK